MEVSAFSECFLFYFFSIFGNLYCIFQDTVEVLMPQDLKKAQTYGNKRIIFENDEVAEMRRFGNSGTLK